MKKIGVLLLISIILLNMGLVFAAPMVNYEGELNYPPFNYMDNGIPQGFDIDLTNLIFDNNNYHVTYSMGDWDDVYSNLKAGKIDTCGLVAINDERKKEVLFSDVVMQFNVGVYTRKDFNNVSLKNLKNYRIAVGKGQYTEKILNDELGIHNYQTYENIQDAIDALNDGKADILFENQEVVNYLLIQKNLKNNIKTQLTNLYPMDVAFAVNKRDTKLVTYINQRLNYLQKSGIYEELYMKYFFTHSNKYYEMRTQRYFTMGAFIVLGLVLIVIITQIYIKYLRRKIMKTNEELQKQYNKLERSEKALKGSEERYRLAFEGANDGLWDCDLLEKVITYSKRCKVMLGYDDEQMGDNYTTFIEMIHPEDMQKHTEVLKEHLKGTTPFYSHEFRLKTKSGEYKWVLNRGKAIFNEDGIPIRIAGSLTDISQRKQNEEIIYNMAFYDSLTGLPNRTLFESKLREAIDNADIAGTKAAILFLDMDNFKYFNDTFGHYFGDKLLIEVSGILRKLTNSEIEVARLGGDEFVILISGILKKEEPAALSSRILTAFRQPLLIDEKEVFITVSIGIAIYPNDGRDVTTLLRNADTAMYSAKESGKNSYKIHSKEMNDKVAEKLELENNLRYALKRKEFEVYYQPKVNIVTGNVEGMEALVRWNKPGSGIISPLKFIPVAEESGLIIPIGLEVLKSACKQNKAWQKEGRPPLRVAVNLSSKQFEQRNLLESIKRILKETALDPKLLELEITESIAMKDFQNTISILSALGGMGIHISLDDFGTGYSSLNYLKNLPINTLKIDKSFVDDITISDNGRNISKALIMMAHSFNLEVVAEGVETQEQLELLKEQGCDVVQGYLYSKPLPAEQFEAFINDRGVKNE